MTLLMRIATISACAALFCAIGCEKSGEPRSDASGATVAAQPADPGVLRDLASYTPTPIPKIGESGAGASSGGDTGTSDVEAQVQAMVGKAITAGFKGEFQTVLECYPKEDVKALSDDTEAMSLLADTYEKLETALKIVSDKTGQPIDLSKYGETIAAKFAEHKIFKVDVLDAKNASVRAEITPEFIRDLLTALGITTLPPENLPIPPQPPTPLKNINGKWCFALPEPIKEEQVAQMKVFLKAAQPAAAKLLEVLENGSFKNMDELTVLLQQGMGPLTMEFMAKMQELEMQAKEEAETKKDSEKKDGDKKDDEKKEDGPK